MELETSVDDAKSGLICLPMSTQTGLEKFIVRRYAENRGDSNRVYEVCTDTSHTNMAVCIRYLFGFGAEVDCPALGSNCQFFTSDSGLDYVGRQSNNVHIRRAR